jgi:hypothetical protein
VKTFGQSGYLQCSTLELCESEGDCERGSEEGLLESVGAISRCL